MGGALTKIPTEGLGGVLVKGLGSEGLDGVLTEGLGGMLTNSSRAGKQPVYAKYSQRLSVLGPWKGWVHLITG